MARERAIKEAEERDRHEMRHRLDIWDDEESDEMYYVDRERWRMVRRRKLDTEEAADAQSRAYEDQQAENLRQESEQFLARQMLEMQSLQEEQRKAGMLLDDSAPIKLNVSIGMGVTAAAAQAQVAAGVHSKGILGLGQEEEEEEETAKKKKLTLTKLEYSLSETGAEKIKQRLEKIKETVPKDREPLFKAKVRWDGMNDVSLPLLYLAVHQLTNVGS
jgi:RNA-binding protein 25